ncbi:MAG: LytR/AlgR family response regulator transcription factor [Clostridium sp.]
MTVSQFGSGEELLRHNKNIDILFLDIQMDGIDGMETARKMRSQNYKGYLIFITVLKEMVFQSFEVQAYDYLVKPIEEECFEKRWRDYFLLCKMQKTQVCLSKRDTRVILLPLMTLFFVKL